MNKRANLKLVSQIIFFGAIWGITEATIGYLLHFLPPTIAGLVMFPIAAFILVKAYKATGSRASMIYVGIIAAGIKAVNFLIPGMLPFKIINPMVSIVMESLLVVVAYPLFSKANWNLKLVGAVTASIGWRLGYVLYMAGEFIVTGFISKYIATPVDIINFVVLNGFASGLLVFGVLKIEPKLTLKTFKFKPVYALAALVLAISLQFII
ncbi:MAG: hypothetical protein J7L77_04850 [Clostridiales bacterium]|nr:hypothetical protein [Clostridiales bacterium]